MTWSKRIKLDAWWSISVKDGKWKSINGQITCYLHWTTYEMWTYTNEREVGVDDVGHCRVIAPVYVGL